MLSQPGGTSRNPEHSSGIQLHFDESETVNDNLNSPPLTTPSECSHAPPCSPLSPPYLLEVVERGEDDFVASSDQTHRRQELQDQRFSSAEQGGERIKTGKNNSSNLHLEQQKSRQGACVCVSMCNGPITVLLQCFFSK